MKNDNHTWENQESPEFFAARLALIGAALATLGDGLATIAAGITLQELEKQNNQEAQDPLDQSKQMEIMQKQIDQLYRKIDRLERKIIRACRLTTDENSLLFLFFIETFSKLFRKKEK